ncbi:MAG: PLDc N-terminal domain-containing protein [Acidobacteriota bacterium]
MISGILGLLAFVVGGLVALALLAFWIWMLVHAITNKGLSDTERIIWVIVIIFVHFLGALIYFFVARPKDPRAG